jgi:hypothetical protein
MPANEYASDKVGLSIRQAAKASEKVLSPKLREEPASSNATMADEQAVSILLHGPFNPSTYEIRPAAIEIAPPVAAYTLEDTASKDKKSVLVIPTATLTISSCSF